MRHSKLTIDYRGGWEKSLDVRSGDRFSRSETEEIYRLPAVTGVLAPSPCHLKVGLPSEFEAEAVRTEILRICQGGRT